MLNSVHTIYPPLWTLGWVWWSVTSAASTALGRSHVGRSMTQDSRAAHAHASLVAESPLAKESDKPPNNNAHGDGKNAETVVHKYLKHRTPLGRTRKISASLTSRLQSDKKKRCLCCNKRITVESETQTACINCSASIFHPLRSSPSKYVLIDYCLQFEETNRILCACNFTTWRRGGLYTVI